MDKKGVSEIKKVLISHINYENPKIAVNFNNRKRLRNSIEKIGIINPVMLMELEDNYEVIDGIARIRALIECDKTEVNSIILQNISLIDGLILHLHLNFQRFSQGEIMELAGRMKEAGLNEDEIASILSTLYITYTSPESIRSFIELRYIFPEAPVAVHRKEVTITTLKILKDLPSEWRKPLFELIRGRSRGEQVSFLKIVESGIISGKVKKLEDIISRSFEESRERCMEKVYPSIHKREKKLRELITSLPFPVNARFPEYLEGGRLKISFEISIYDNESEKIDTLKDLIRDIKRIILDEV